MQLVNVFLVNIAHSYMIKSFLGLRNGNEFTEAETGEPPISRQKALECTKSHIKFQNYPRTPVHWGLCPQTPGKGGGAGRGGKERRKGGIRKGKNFGPPTFQT